MFVTSDVKNDIWIQIFTLYWPTGSWISVKFDHFWPIKACSYTCNIFLSGYKSPLVIFKVFQQMSLHATKNPMLRCLLKSLCKKYVLYWKRGYPYEHFWLSLAIFRPSLKKISSFYHSQDCHRENYLSILEPNFQNIQIDGTFFFFAVQSPKFEDHFCEGIWLKLQNFEF